MTLKLNLVRKRIFEKTKKASQCLLFQAVACKLFKWHTNGSTVAAVYLMIAMALDRVVAIKYPFTHRAYTSKWVAMAIALVAVLCGYIVIAGKLLRFCNICIMN